LNTLITAANSAHAYRLKNKLNPANIILGDYLDLAAFMLTSFNMIRLPHPNSIAYTHEMLTLCIDKQITTIYALREEEKVLQTAEQLFNEYGITIIID
jgi:hypothetical protein